jgi:hypothetical protein
MESAGVLIDPSLISDFWDNCNRIFNAVTNIHLMNSGIFLDNVIPLGDQLDHNDAIIENYHNTNSRVLAEIRQVNPTFATGG